jgi:hypothetical protein
MPRGTSPLDEAQIQRRLWTPALFGGRLLGWYDASVSASFTLSGSAVTEWRDQSGNGNHLQSSGVNAPLLGTFASTTASWAARTVQQPTPNCGGT